MISVRYPKIGHICKVTPAIQTSWETLVTAVGPRVSSARTSPLRFLKCYHGGHGSVRPKSMCSHRGESAPHHTGPDRNLCRGSGASTSVNLESGQTCLMNLPDSNSNICRRQSADSSVSKVKGSGFGINCKLTGANIHSVVTPSIAARTRGRREQLAQHLAQLA